MRDVLGSLSFLIVIISFIFLVLAILLYIWIRYTFPLKPQSVKVPPLNFDVSAHVPLAPTIINARTDSRDVTSLTHSSLPLAKQLLREAGNV